jgi:deoxyadenosine/deoxycytidine kinase
MVIISIEGLMGSGKTTVLKALSEHGFMVATEPVEKWSFLHKFYEDSQKYSLILQIQILLTFMEQDFPKDLIVFVERSPDVSRHVFAEMLYSDGKLSEHEMSLYIDLYNKLSPWKPDAYVYLETPVDVCIERQASRGDSYKISKEYMLDLERSYNSFFETNGRVVINSNRAAEDVVKDVMTAVEYMSSR